MKNATQFNDVEQGSDEWFALRIGKVTSSNYGIIMANECKAFGEPAKKYALTLALEMCTGKKSEYGFINENMERGTAQEPIARLLYEELSYCSVINGGFFDGGRYGDSPDGLVGNNGVIEIKSVIPTTHYSTLCRGGSDPAYKWQVIGHLEATGRDWCDFVSYCLGFTESKQLLVYRTYRKEITEEIERLRERRNEFIKLIDKITETIRD